MKEYLRGLATIFALPFEFSALQALVWWRWQTVLGAVPTDSFGVSRWWDVAITPAWVVGGAVIFLILGSYEFWPAVVSLSALLFIATSYVFAMIDGVTIGFLILSPPLFLSIAVLAILGVRLLKRWMKKSE